MNTDAVKAREAVEQLESEVALLSRLQHPNIVRYLATAREANSLYIFLEYVPVSAVPQTAHAPLGSPMSCWPPAPWKESLSSLHAFPLASPLLT